MPCLAVLAPAWREQAYPGTVEDFLEHLQEGSGARTFGHWEDEAGAHLTEQARQRPDVHEALRRRRVVAVLRLAEEADAGARAVAAHTGSAVSLHGLGNVCKRTVDYEGARAGRVGRRGAHGAPLGLSAYFVLDYHFWFDPYYYLHLHLHLHLHLYFDFVSLFDLVVAKDLLRGPC